MKVFFFKQKAEYDMRISDWRSDGCSSDLVLAGEAHHQVGRGCHRDTVAGRDDQWIAVDLAAQDPAQLRALVAQRRIGAAHLVWSGAAADEDLLGHANARQAGGPAEARANAQPARMRAAVAVDEGQVRRLRPSFPRPHQYRPFAVGQQHSPEERGAGQEGDRPARYPRSTEPYTQ